MIQAAIYASEDPVFVDMALENDILAIYLQLLQNTTISAGTHEKLLFNLSNITAGSR